MYWQTDTPPEKYRVPENVVDVTFGVRCRALPVDHAWSLRTAVVDKLPWLQDEAAAGIHSLHVAESGNGWQRPEQPDALLYPSRRTRLVLRLPRERVGDAESLVGATLNIAGHELVVEASSVRPLSELTTLFSRYVVAEGVEMTETAFLAEMHQRLFAMSIRPRKMLCGIERHLGSPDGRIQTRSLMLADLDIAESVRLQESGLGPHRLLGCGLFLPHKGIQEVGSARE